MKSEHRHELKTNELAEWIANFPQWVRENAKTIICVSILLIAAAGLYVYRTYKKDVVLVGEQLKFTNLINQLSQGRLRVIQAGLQGMDASYMLMPLADNLQAAAKSTKVDDMAALALIKQAQTLRMELHYRLGTIDKKDLIAQINKAKIAYSKAIEKSSSNPSLMAAAKFGLGLCEEEIGNFEKARQIYSDITTEAAFEGTTVLAQAKLRLDTMADYQQEVVFREAPKPAPTESTEPQIDLQVPDLNLPGR